MDHFKYHPLVDCDTDGMEKVPMFFSYDRNTVADKHSHYLEEIVPHHYRLIARDAHSYTMAIDYIIHCPICGAVMDRISNPINNYKLSLYVCPRCRQAANS